MGVILLCREVSVKSIQRFCRSSQNKPLGRKVNSITYQPGLSTHNEDCGGANRTECAVSVHWLRDETLALETGRTVRHFAVPNVEASSRVSSTVSGQARPTNSVGLQFSLKRFHGCRREEAASTSRYKGSDLVIALDSESPPQTVP